MVSNPNTQPPHYERIHTTYPKWIQLTTTPILQLSIGIRHQQRFPQRILHKNFLTPPSAMTEIGHPIL